jgi:prepilin-type N-terminal cleavage/methylation domain-containing protein
MPGARGFTLIEIALAVFILGLLVGSILVPLHTQVEQRQTRETQRQLEEIREALVGFALAKGYLPCPDRTSGGAGTANDTANDGVEDYNTGTGACGVIVATAPPNLFSMGNVPWVTLGMGRQDAWGNRLRYVVLSGFAQRSPATSVTLSTNDNMGNLRVCETAACALTLSTTAVAVILSHGSNSYGAVNSANVTNAASPSADEVENTDADRNFVSRPRFTGGLATSEFDDIVIWLSRYTLFNRMTAAGSLSP